MAEPISFSIAAKWTVTAIGSCVGSAVALVAAPAMNTVDAKLRFMACLAFTMCSAPAVTRAVIRWCAISPDSIPDTTLAVACSCGVLSWWVIHGFVAVAKKHSEGFAEFGLAQLLPQFKKKDAP